MNQPFAGSAWATNADAGTAANVLRQQQLQRGHGSQPPPPPLDPRKQRRIRRNRWIRAAVFWFIALVYSTNLIPSKTNSYGTAIAFGLVGLSQIVLAMSTRVPKG